jgi:protein-S-isoprenylcysteine O-methyltransferase Ste14
LSVTQQLELKIPPLLLVAISALVMWIVSRTGTSMTVAVPARLIVAGALAAGGIALALAGGFAFFRAHTTVDPTRPGATSRVVASGVYRFQIAPEERILGGKFGRDYDEYLRAVRRWL